MQVIKRDGIVSQFDSNKIRNAISKAFIEVDKELTEESNLKINSIQFKI